MERRRSRVDHTDTGLLPTFLVIGAMKAGTTTLYRDLLSNAHIFFPVDKEPEALVSDDILTDDGLARYASLFQKAERAQARGEASTAYAKVPTYEGTAGRAREVLGPELRIIYMVRHPVDRIESQHYHEYAAGLVGPDVNEEVKEDDRYVAYSSYAEQLRPWLDNFDSPNIKVVKFEHYVTNRAEVVEDISRFLGVPPQVEGIDATARYRSRSEVRLVSGPWRAIQGSFLYRNVVRPTLNIETRRRLRHALLPSAGAQPSSLSEATRSWLWEQLEDECSALRSLTGDRTLSWG